MMHAILNIDSFSFCITESRFTRETKTPSREDMLLVQSIQITDKFGFDKQTALEKSRSSSETVFVSTDPAAFCVNGLGKYKPIRFALQNYKMQILMRHLLFYLSIDIQIKGIIVAGTVFLLAQLAVIAIWTYLYQRRRKMRSIDNCSSSYGPSLQTSTLPGSRTDSLSKLYDYDHTLSSRHGHF